MPSPLIFSFFQKKKVITRMDQERTTSFLMNSTDTSDASGPSPQHQRDGVMIHANPVDYPNSIVVSSVTECPIND